MASANAAIRSINKVLVLRALREHGHATRSALAKMLGLQASTLTGLSRSLIDSGLVIEVDQEPAETRAVGRPAINLALSGSSRYFAGLEIGQSVSTALVLDLNGDEVARAVQPVSLEADPTTVETNLATLLKQAIADTQDVEARLDGIGVAVPGVVDGQTIADAPGFGWKDAPFGQILHRTFGLRVTMENDANAAAISETQFGKASACRSLAYILLDRGVGVGLILDGTLYRGHFGKAGEAGHIRTEHALGTGKLEELAGIDRLSRRSDPSDAMRELLNLRAQVKAGDLEAVSLLESWETQISWLLEILSHLVAPQLILLGGRASAIIDKNTLNRLSQSPITGGLVSALDVSTFGTDAIVMGAASLPMNNFFTVPDLEPAPIT